MARRGGFTLFEIMIVVAIIAIGAMFVIPNMAPNETSRVRDEADRLALLISAMQQEAILKFRNFALQAYTDHYEFLEVGGEEPKQLEDIFRPRKMPDDVVIKVDKEANPSVNINDLSGGETPQEEEIAGEEEEKKPKDPPELTVLILASGELTPFNMRFVSDEGAEITVEGGITGRLKVFNPRESFGDE